VYGKGWRTARVRQTRGWTPMHTHALVVQEYQALWVLPSVQVHAGGLEKRPFTAETRVRFP
jgi:hypothetical protein